MASNPNYSDVTPAIEALARRSLRTAPLPRTTTCATM